MKCLVECMRILAQIKRSEWHNREVYGGLYARMYIGGSGQLIRFQLAHHDRNVLMADWAEFDCSFPKPIEPAVGFDNFGNQILSVTYVDDKTSDYQAWLDSVLLDVSRLPSIAASYRLTDEHKEAAEIEALFEWVHEVIYSTWLPAIMSKGVKIKL